MKSLSTNSSRTRILDILLSAGLVLFLLLLPFHLVIKRLLPDPLGTYWKEALLGFLVLLWIVRCLIRRRIILSDTSLDLPVSIYLGLLLLRFVLDRAGLVAAWGLYVSVLYLPLFWLVPAALDGLSGRDSSDRRDWSRVLVVVFVCLGALIALGGLIEFLFDVSLWPSDELLQRQGFSDMFIYDTHVRRVYFTFDSPTTLANTLAMLLPLALALTLISRNVWARVAAALAAVLMAGCIVVTFSRGIWVATLLALLGMGLLSGYARRNWRLLAAGVVTLVLIGLAWGLASIFVGREPGSSYQGVVELSPEAYEEAPVVSVELELLQVEPLEGVYDLQTWVLFDPIAGQNDERDVLFEHPPESGKEEIVYRVTVPEQGALRFAIALSPDVWSPEKGDGASFQIYVAEVGVSEEGQFALVRYINPKHNPSDRRWRNFLVDLSPWAGREVNLSFITEGGPVGDWAYDWAGWADLQLVSVEPGYFASAQTENAVLRHTGSILDWARDETNRDRLAAWNLALRAWRAAPLWGNGLGSTGVAALRTNPETAFVTESQVLKSLVELGLPGIAALAFLWYSIARVGYSAYTSADDPTKRLLLLGILTSLLVVFIEGLVYQNLEVKQVNAFFWTLLGLLAFWSREAG